MIEKLLLKSGNVKPMRKVLELTKMQKGLKEKINVAEIGIGWGATSVELIKILGQKDTYYYFDFEHHVKELYDDLYTINENKVNIIGFGNTTKRYDSYSWNLAKLYLKWKEEGNAQRLDIAYLDGAHTFLFDASAACMLKEMIVLGGYIVLDDINWSLEKSSKCNPQKNPGILKEYTQEQIETCQIKVVKECFFDSDDRYKEIESCNRIAVFQRIK